MTCSSARAAAALLAVLIASNDALAERIVLAGTAVSFERPATSYKECPIVARMSIEALRAKNAPCFRGEGRGVTFYLDWASCICVRTGARRSFPMFGLAPLADTERRLTLEEFAVESERYETLVGPRFTTVAGTQAIEIATVTRGPTTDRELPAWRLVNHRFVLEIDDELHDCSLAVNEGVYRRFVDTFVSFCESVRKADQP